MDAQDLANSLFGASRIETTSPNTISTLQGVAMADSADGKVKVKIAGESIPEDADAEEENTVVELPTTPAVKEGDTVTITAEGGALKVMTVTGNTGSGDRAKQATDDASKVATNYIDIDENKGITVGDMTEGTLGANTYIDANGVHVRDGETVVASFNESDSFIGYQEGSEAKPFGDNTKLSFVRNSEGKNAFEITVSPGIDWDRGKYLTSLYSEFLISLYSQDGMLQVGTPAGFYVGIAPDVQMRSRTSGAEINVGGNSSDERKIELVADKIYKGYARENGSEIHGAKVLYDNATGTNGAVTLSESAENFDYLEIFFNYGSSNSATQCAGYTKVYSPNGKYVSLNMSNQITSASVVQNLCEIVQISGTQIKRTTSKGWYINGTVTAKSASSGANSNNAFYIQRVVGLK